MTGSNKATSEGWQNKMLGSDFLKTLSLYFLQPNLSGCRPAIPSQVVGDSEAEACSSDAVTRGRADINDMLCSRFGQQQDLESHKLSDTSKAPSEQAG